MNAPTRPVVRWHGGKFRLAPWIISHMPPHEAYTEAFGGAASVLLQKARSRIEIYNDLDIDIVNLFRVLRDPNDAARLIKLLELTPFSRVEFAESLEPCEDIIEQSRRVVVRAFMGFGSNACASISRGELTTGFRGLSRQSTKQPANDWATHAEALWAVVERMRGVTIENADARDILADHDSKTTLHYVDPPYLPEVRESGSKVGRMYRRYRHELGAPGHQTLIEALRGLKGMVLLSGYRSDIYETMLTGWKRFDTTTFADGARKRVESLWLNPRAQIELIRYRCGHDMPLFEVKR